MRKCSSGRRGSREAHFNVAALDHANSQPDQIGGTCIFHRVEGDGGGGENGGDTQRCSKYVKQAADESSHGRLNPFALPSGEAARQNVEDAGTRCDRQNESRGEEQRKTMGIEHETILAARLGRGKVGLKERSCVSGIGSKSSAPRSIRAADGRQFRIQQRGDLSTGKTGLAYDGARSCLPGQID